jgi:hypothetical protein
MSRYEVHCRESLLTFGAPFEEVHRWLDEFAGTPEYGMRHRRVRHHAAGIREAVRLFGADADKAARQHIVSDLKEEGWTETDPFPKDEKDYVRMGLF